MFTNEDFDLDEDFLNDVSQKESQYYSQPLSSNEESSTKRFKKNEDSSRQSHNESISSKLIHAESKADFVVQNTDNIEGQKTVRTNLILERLNRNENITAEPRPCQPTDEINGGTLNSTESSLAQKPILHRTNDKCRKNRILEKLKKNNVPSTSTCSRSHEEQLSPTNISSVNPNNLKSEHTAAIGKSQLKPVITCNKPIALIRQFPGPAGLVPHPSGGRIPPLITESMSFSNSNNNPATDITVDTSIISKYCSQNTTNLFSEGAWRSLMSDLSPDFFNGHEISTIEEKVLTDLYQNNKIPFLAGIVQRVDFSSLDPSVVLKDCTGTIRGTICKNILVEYPHVLDIGVVLFLGDVGFLKIGSYLKKCHVIITLRNIINVYTCKSRMFSISEMNARLQNFNHHRHSCKSVVDQVSNRPGSLNSEFESGSSATESARIQLRLSNLKNNDNLDERKHVNLKGLKTSIDNNTNLSKDNEKNSNKVQRINSVNIKSTFESEDRQDFDDDFAASFLDIDDDILFSETATNIDSITNSESQTHGALSTNENIAASKKSSTLNPKLLQHNKHKMYNENTKIPEAKEKSNQSKISDIKLKLSVFKSDSELTQQPCENLGVTSTEAIQKENDSSFASSLLLNRDNDSDEELFSQLDVEAIVSNYNRLNDVN